MDWTKEQLHNLFFYSFLSLFLFAYNLYQKLRDDELFDLGSLGATLQYKNINNDNDNDNDDDNNDCNNNKDNNNNNNNNDNNYITNGWIRMTTTTTTKIKTIAPTTPTTTIIVNKTNNIIDSICLQQLMIYTIALW